jgi:hypothetical protein
MKPKRNKGRKNTKNTEKQVELRVHREVRNKVHDSGTLIASLQALLSIANSLEMFHSLRSLLTNSSQLSFRSTSTSISLYIIDPLQNPTTHRRLRRPPLDMTKHLNRYWINLFSIGVTPTLPWISSFWTLSLLVCPQSQHNIHISSTFSYLLAFEAPSCVIIFNL